MLHDLRHHALGYTNRRCDVAGMQRHVPALDAFKCERAQRREVLRQADAHEQLGQRARIGVADERVRIPAPTS